MTEMRLPAIEVAQGNRRLYQFAIDGKRLSDVTTVSRIHRDAEHRLGGYQRPEALAHIGAIRRYLESGDALMPNALVVAFDDRVRFEPSAGSEDEFTRAGHLVIPAPAEADGETKPGWVVDGQQRSAALRDADIDSFPVPVVAFITNDMREHRAQFILVNSTKPLPKGLIHELLPTTDAALPVALARKRFPALLMERLNYDGESPLRGLIRTPTQPEGVIKDNSMLKMLENRVSDGALYEYREAETGEGEIETMLQLLFNFWAAVADVFPQAWGLAPRQSRLMHGVGIASLGYVMDAITDKYRRIPDKATYAGELEPLRDVCAWTSGWWDFGLNDRRRWNELQNTPSDIALLTDHLLAEYRARNAGPGAGTVIRSAAG